MRKMNPIVALVQDVGTTGALEEVAEALETEADLLELEEMNPVAAEKWREDANTIRHAIRTSTWQVKMGNRPGWDDS